MSSDTVFRTSAPAPEIVVESPKLPDPEPNNEQTHHDIGLEEPVDSEKAQETVLSALGVDDMVQNLSEQDQSNLAEVTQYALNILSKRGVDPTASRINETLTNLKSEMGLDENAAPEVVLDRIGGVVKAWKNLTFITDPKEKRSMFMKLARQPDSKSMNKLVFEEMNRREIWL